MDSVVNQINACDIGDGVVLVVGRAGRLTGSSSRPIVWPLLFYLVSMLWAAIRDHL